MYRFTTLTTWLCHPAESPIPMGRHPYLGEADDGTGGADDGEDGEPIKGD